MVPFWARCLIVDHGCLVVYQLCSHFCGWTFWTGWVQWLSAELAGRFVFTRKAVWNWQAGWAQMAFLRCLVVCWLGAAGVTCHLSITIQQASPGSFRWWQVLRSKRGKTPCPSFLKKNLWVSLPSTTVFPLQNCFYSNSTKNVLVWSLNPLK